MPNHEMTDSEIEVRPFQFEDIRWTGKKMLADEAQWTKRLDFIRTLLSRGRVLDYIDTLAAPNTPRYYEISGVAVEFLPHWEFYSLGGNLNLPIPENSETLEKDIEVAKYIRGRLAPPESQD